jgi:hypothetical protein
MVRLRQLIFFAFMLGVIGSALAGCSGRAASPEKGWRSATAAPIRETPRISAKAALHEGAFSVYNEPEYGVAFQYPRNYALEEGEVEEPIAGVKTQAELTDEQPEAVLLATVVIPEDGYPNTTFESGSLQFVVSPSLMSRSCKELLVEPDGGGGRRRGTLNIQGVLFNWVEDITLDAEAGTEAVERDYVGYADGACYEFFARVTVGKIAENAGLEKQADAKKIVRHLEKIVSSVQWEAKRGAAGEKTSE